jgi:hypothetical protein
MLHRCRGSSINAPLMLLKGSTPGRESSFEQIRRERLAGGCGPRLIMAALRCGCQSYCGPSAVDDKGLPGHIAGGVGGEEEQRAVEFVGLREATMPYIDATLITLAARAARRAGRAGAMNGAARGHGAVSRTTEATLRAPLCSMQVCQVVSCGPSMGVSGMRPHSAQEPS